MSKIVDYFKGVRKEISRIKWTSKKDLLKYALAFFGALVLLIDWKNIKKKWFALLLLLVALSPYLRYLVLANHSYRHSFFTFREQIISCIAIITAILEILN